MIFRPPYAIATLVLFVTELLIALFVHDRWIRPHAGDALAVALVYLALRALTKLSVVPAVVAAFAFAVTIELGQLFHLIDALGLRGSRIARFILGGSFDLLDFVFYAAGALGVLIVEGLITSAAKTTPPGR